MLRAQPPTHRPVWMIVLAATMLLFGGGELVGGLMALRDPGARNAIRNVPRPPAAEEAARKLEPILDDIVARNRQLLRADTIVSTAFGLFTLYAVAAVLSRDRNGRRLAVLTGVFGIAFQVAELPLKMHIARETVAAGGPLLSDVLNAAGEGVRRTESELVGALNMVAALLALLGIGWCVLVLVYFGGRRGQQLYGLRP
jgi:hypothetical protein